MATLTELKAKAKKLGVKGYYKMSKAELQERLKPKLIKVKKKKRKVAPKEKVQKPKISLDDLTEDKTQIVSEVLTKAVKNMTFKQAAKVVVDFVVNALTSGGISGTDLDRDRNLVRAMALMKLNVFTVNNLIELENYESYYYDATANAEMATDDNAVYQYESSDTAAISAPVMLRGEFTSEDREVLERQDTLQEVFNVCYGVIFQNSFANEYDNETDNPEDPYEYLYNFTGNTLDNEENIEYMPYSSVRLQDAIAGYIIKDILGRDLEDTDNEITDFDSLDDAVDNGDIPLSDIISGIRLRAVGDAIEEEFPIYGSPPNIDVDCETLARNLDAEQQKDLFDAVQTVRDDEGDYLLIMDDDDITAIKRSIDDRGEWISNMPRFANLLSGLVYGYVDSDDIQQDVYDVSDERYVDYYGFSFTKREYIDGDEYTVASNNRLQDILREMNFKQSVIDAGAKLDEIATLRVSQGEPKFNV